MFVIINLTRFINVFFVCSLQLIIQVKIDVGYYDLRVLIDLKS